jgi:GxxExxY protein
MGEQKDDPRTYAIIGAAMEVHRVMGNGFLEAVYREALGLEFAAGNIPFQREVDLPVMYKDTTLGVAYRADFICYDGVVVELKAQKELCSADQSQVINYLKAAGMEVGLLINFGSSSLQYKRFVKSKHTSAPTLPA